jgi:hypothetical protein
MLMPDTIVELRKCTPSKKTKITSHGFGNPCPEARKFLHAIRSKTQTTIKHAEKPKISERQEEKASL